jgi:hypothetical protein
VEAVGAVVYKVTANNAGALDVDVLTEGTTVTPHPDTIPVPELA